MSSLLGNHVISALRVRRVPAVGFGRGDVRLAARRSRRRRSVPASSRRCAGATSARIAPGGRRRRPACRASRTPSTSAWCNGGVWKTTDAGRTWKPIFDDQPTGSIGSVAVAPSDPNIIYVGSGEGLQRPDLAIGDGIYKSTDAGKTWTHLGLRDAQQIPEARGRSEEPEPPVRRRARPSLRPERGARHLPLDRRRPVVRARALQGREHRRQGRRHRSRPTPTSSTRRCGSSGRGRGRTAPGAAPTAASSSRPTAARRGSS